VLVVLDDTGAPYDLSPEFVDELFSKHKIDYIIHGDDPCLLPDGSDAYAHAKKLGRFRDGEASAASRNCQAAPCTSSDL